jgi:hypothetical protein
MFRYPASLFQRDARQCGTIEAVLQAVMIASTRDMNSFISTEFGCYGLERPCAVLTRSWNASAYAGVNYILRKFPLFYKSKAHLHHHTYKAIQRL